MSFSSSTQSTSSPLVGKYLNVDKLEYSPYGESWGYKCYCVSFDNGVYTVRNKFGKEFKANINQITSVIDITETQKYRVGDIVEVKIDYCQHDGDWITDFCQVLSVKNFCNEFDYFVKSVKNGKTYDREQSSIIKVVTLKQSKYMIGSYVGVNTYIGPQWDMEVIVKNGTITKVNNSYQQITYEIKYDSGETGTIYEECITTPAVVKTKQQIQLDNMEFLRNEEQRLLQQLEAVRAARSQ